MTEPIRWGICGTGEIAARFVDALANVPDAEAIAVGSNDQDRSDHFGESHEIPRRYGSYEELATDSEVDVVYVASTQERHMRDTLLFLESGRHVLCEKPFALNTSQVEKMISAASSIRSLSLVSKRLQRKGSIAAISIGNFQRLSDG